MGLCDKVNLNHVMLLVQPLQRLALGQLEQGDLRRHEPAEQEPEDGVVAERNDVLKFPEDGPAKVSNTSASFFFCPRLLLEMLYRRLTPARHASKVPIGGGGQIRPCLLAFKQH